MKKALILISISILLIALLNISCIKQTAAETTEAKTYLVKVHNTNWGKVNLWLSADSSDGASRQVLKNFLVNMD